ncbi:MAG: NADAR family protein [Chloroflexi bacterium]|nr:NADAR family protein [Chloroflexota bacterium]MYF21494.1 NADAR family protein [Chloroflexota bacterium]
MDSDVQVRSQPNAVTPKKGHPYRTSKVASFRKTRESWGGLSNMASGFPLKVGPVEVPSSEALYQACRSPDIPLVQHRIVSQKSAMKAKMVRRPYEEFTRDDWDEVRVPVMDWCLRLKLSQHIQSFGDLLWATGDRPIVENSHRDDFWGAIPQGDSLVGLNVLGRLLMRLRRELINDGPSAFEDIEPPRGIRNLTLFGERVGTVAKVTRVEARSMAPITIPRDSLVRLWSSFDSHPSRPVLVNSTTPIETPNGGDDLRSISLKSDGRQMKLMPAIDEMN